MTDLDEGFDRLIAETVVPALKPRGYRKKRLTWTRETPTALHEIVLQRSQGNTATHLRVYIEGAAYVPEFDRMLGNTVPASLGRLPFRPGRRTLRHDSSGLTRLPVRLRRSESRGFAPVAPGGYRGRTWMLRLRRH